MNPVIVELNFYSTANFIFTVLQKHDVYCTIEEKDKNTYHLFTGKKTANPVNNFINKF